ncbi:MAG: flagellar biosynthesis protein FlhF [Phycisphaeraceae bacterium]
MNLKTYKGRTMAEVLAQVKNDLGVNAVILHTRTYRQGGLLGLGARPVVEVSAADGRQIGHKRRRVVSRSAADSHNPVVKQQLPPQSPAVSGPAAHASAGDLIRRTYAAAKVELGRTPQPPPVASPGGAPAGPGQDSVGNSNASSLKPQASSPDPPPTPITTTTDQLADEMRAMRQMVGQMMRRQAEHGPKPHLPEKLFDHYLNLLKQEVAEDLADEVVQHVQTSLSSAELQDESVVRRAVLNRIARQVPIDASAGVLKPTTDGRPRTIALVGPTGVGKTTTLAKLAATFKLKQNKSVALISLDTYRIAAVEQLRTYADILKVPLHVVVTLDELHQAIRDCAGCDVILIDTAGRSQRDDPKLVQLAEFIAAARPHEVHLVLASTCTQSVLLDTIQKFSRVRADRIIFTKLDEAVTFGVLLNVIRKARKRLSYVTTGQEVPHQIEPGRPDRLAALVMGDAAR